jgi:hypothetical protein
MTVRICDDRGAAGFSWIVDEPMSRASHVLASDGRTWIVDPVDDPAVMERVAALGEPQAVLQLLDRHNRDSAAVAARLGVPRIVAPTELPGTPFLVVGLKRRPWWKEVALWWDAERLLLVPEAVGTNRFFTADRGPAGMHLFVRPFPPRRALGRFAPEHLLVGHGEGLHGPAATEGLRWALADSRKGLLSVLRVLPSMRG